MDVWEVIGCKNNIFSTYAVKKSLYHDRIGPLGQTGPVGPSGESNPSKVSNRSSYPALAANAALVLINVASALLGRQVESLAGAFEQEGGFTERLYRTRTERRRRGH